MYVTVEVSVGLAGAAGAVLGAGDGGAGVAASRPVLAASVNLARLAPVKIGWGWVLGPMIGLLINCRNGNLCGFYFCFS